MMIDSVEILKIVRGLIKFPYPQICRHMIACELLGLLKDSGEDISDELMRYVVRADDISSYPIINEMIEKKNN